MKMRNGFVSNSSASSFIVRHIDDIGNMGEKNSRGGLLNEATINKLLKFGFKVTGITHPSHLDNADYTDQSVWEAWKNNKGKVITQSYGYRVSCNEDEVISFLVKNDIGFIANGHYGHVTYLFHKGDKHVMVFRNYGAEVETYHHDKKWEEISETWKQYGGKPYYRIPIKDLME
jgi:hypothetical protein